MKREEAIIALESIRRFKEMCGGKDADGIEALNLAITAIETLRADLARVTAERDAAIRDIYSGNANDCDTCVHGCDYNDDCPIIIGADCKYQWRGLKQED